MDKYVLLISVTAAVDAIPAIGCGRIGRLIEPFNFGCFFNMFCHGVEDPSVMRRSMFASRMTESAATPA